MMDHPMRAAGRSDRLVLKICGITREQDAHAAVEHGATALGFVFWPRSPRYVDPDAAGRIIEGLPSDVITVGVVVDESVTSLHEIVRRSGIRVLQLHGGEEPDVMTGLPYPVIRSIGVEDGAGDAWPAETVFLLDASDPVRRGGTGRTVDWHRAAAIARRRPMLLAGGLTPDNVSEAIGIVRPLGVDVSSGVEESPGVKDVDKLRRFLTAARQTLTGKAVRA